MSDPQAISSHDPIESTDGTLELVAQATQRGAEDARVAAARTWTATGLFVSGFVYKTCYIISYGVVFPSVLLARAVPVNNAAVRGLIEGAQAAQHKVDELHHPALVPSTDSALPALAPT
ncbi:MAG: hypothetical protein ACXVBO_17020 [Isosphaeraceae bacterium]